MCPLQELDRHRGCGQQGFGQRSADRPLCLVKPTDATHRETCQRCYPASLSCSSPCSCTRGRDPLPFPAGIKSSLRGPDMTVRHADSYIWSRKRRGFFYERVPAEFIWAFHVIPPTSIRKSCIIPQRGDRGQRRERNRRVTVTLCSVTDESHLPISL